MVRRNMWLSPLLPCYINCAFGGCLSEIILLSVGKWGTAAASRGAPDCLSLWKMAFMMDLGGGQVTICTLDCCQRGGACVYFGNEIMDSQCLGVRY